MTWQCCCNYHLLCEETWTLVKFHLVANHSVVVLLSKNPIRLLMLILQNNTLYTALKGPVSSIRWQEETNRIWHVCLWLVSLFFFFSFFFTFFTLWQADNDILGFETYLQVIGSSSLKWWEVGAVVLPHVNKFTPRCCGSRAPKVLKFKVGSLAAYYLLTRRQCVWQPVMGWTLFHHKMPQNRYTALVKQAQAQQQKCFIAE